MTMYEVFSELVRSRKSSVGFGPEPVADELVMEVIEAARWAPSAGNSQPWDFVVVRDPRSKQTIVDLCAEQQSFAYRMEQTRRPELRFPSLRTPPDTAPIFASAPVFVVVVGDPRSVIAYPLLSAAYSGESNYYSSLANVVLYMQLAIAALGLASRWITATGFPFVDCMLKELLDIPDELKIYDTVALGYPEAPERSPRPRVVLELEEVVHHERFDPARRRTVEQVEAFVASLR